MKNIRFRELMLLGGFTLLIASLFFGRATAQVNAPAPLPKWEYKAIYTASVPDFNDLGAQGWELCTALGPYPSNNVPVTFLFKRPVR